MEDADFLRRLKAISGEDALWDGFDPSSWRSIMAEGASNEAAESTTAVSGEESNPQGDDHESDDSAEMIFNYHKLTRKERALNRRCKLSKARQYASEEPAVPQDPEEIEKLVQKLEDISWNETGLRRGEVSPEGATFVPWRLVAAYPDMFVGKTNGPRAAPLFKAEALHQNRVWDFYYVHCPPQMSEKPVFFVPTYQFQHLLDVVNAKLETRLAIPAGKNEDRFKMSFGLGNSPRPRFLGRSDSLAAYKRLRGSVPNRNRDDNLDKATQAGRQAFEHLLSRTRSDRRSRKRSDRNRLKRITAHKAWGRSVKRVQRYLGLRRKVTDPTVGGAGTITNLNLDLPMPEKPEGSVLFVAIDVEAWEKDQNLITEVGIATLDTAEIQDIAPGETGKGWFPHIRARHIRVAENSWAINKRYVKGCADKFSFGTSEFVKQSFLAPLIRSTIEGATFLDPVDGTTKPRRVVLVFHEASADIKFMKQLGYHVESAPNVADVADTREMHQSLVCSNDSASLATVLGYLGIPYRHLHNAGNDAVYTLQAMVGLAVRKRVVSLERARERKKKVDEGHVPFAEFVAPEDKEGWTSGEDTDGGDPVALFDPESSSEADRSSDWW